jgi:hypothetical protein
MLKQITANFKVLSGVMGLLLSHSIFVQDMHASEQSEPEVLLIQSAWDSTGLVKRTLKVLESTQELTVTNNDFSNQSLNNKNRFVFTSKVVHPEGDSLKPSYSKLLNYGRTNHKQGKLSTVGRWVNGTLIRYVNRVRMKNSTEQSQRTFLLYPNWNKYRSTHFVNEDYLVKGQFRACYKIRTNKVIHDFTQFAIDSMWLGVNAPGLNYKVRYSREYGNKSECGDWGQVTQLSQSNSIVITDDSGLSNFVIGENVGELRGGLSVNVVFRATHIENKHTGEVLYSTGPK